MIPENLLTNEFSVNLIISFRPEDSGEKFSQLYDLVTANQDKIMIADYDAKIRSDFIGQGGLREEEDGTYTQVREDGVNLTGLIWDNKGTWPRHTDPKISFMYIYNLRSITLICLRSFIDTVEEYGRSNNWRVPTPVETDAELNEKIREWEKNNNGQEEKPTV